MGARDAAFEIHGVAVSVRSDSAELVELVSRRLRAFATTAAPAEPISFDLRVVPAHVVEQPRGPSRTVYEPEIGEVLYLPESDELYVDYGRVRAVCRASGSEVVVSVLEPVSEAAWAATRPLFTLPLLELLKRRGLYPVHAAAVASAGSAVVLAGTSGAGKTTLALALVRAGFDFLGDDMLLLDPGRNGDRPLVLAFPDELDLSATTVALFPELEPHLESELYGVAKRQLPSDRLGGKLAENARPSVLLFPEIVSGPSAIEPCSVDAALLALAPNVLLTDGDSSGRHLEALGRLARASRCYRLSSGRDLERAAALVRDLVR